MTEQSMAAVAVVAEGGYMVGLADRGIAGYTPTTYTFDTYEEARACADNINTSLGLTPQEVGEIVLTTMRLRELGITE